MIVNIYRSDQVIAQIKPNDSSELSQQKQIEDVVNLSFVNDTYIDLQIGDYLILDKTSQKYFLNKLPSVTDVGSFEYDCIFEGKLHDLKKTTVLLDKDFNFPLTGNAHTFLQFMVENLNRNGGSYIVGKYKDTDDLTVEFANWNVFEAITELGKLLTFDWYLEGDTLNFDSKDFETSYVLQVGLKDGFTQLKRTTVESKDIATVVYGYGSTSNLPPRVGDGITYDSPLLMENRLYFSGVDGDSKLEANIDRFGIREKVVVFEDIQPERTGTVTSVDSEDERIFFDTGIEFNINDYLLSNIKPKIKFISGELLGIEFNISYDDTSNQITLDIFSDESGSYPNNTLKPEVGDEYKLYDVTLPQSYIDTATVKLEEATQTYLDEHSVSMVIYEGDIDKEYIEANDVSLNIGDTVRIVSPIFGIDNYYDIKGLNQNINNPFVYKIQFGDVLPKGLIATLLQNSFNTKQSIYTVSSTQITNNEVTNITGDENQWE